MASAHVSAVKITADLIPYPTVLNDMADCIIRCQKFIIMSAVI